MHFIYFKGAHLLSKFIYLFISLYWLQQIINCILHMDKFISITCDFDDQFMVVNKLGGDIWLVDEFSVTDFDIYKIGKK